MERCYLKVRTYTSLRVEDSAPETCPSVKLPLILVSEYLQLTCLYPRRREYVSYAGALRL